MTNPFTQIHFNARYHSYTLRGKPLTSVTKFAKQFYKEFDSDYWSKHVAKKRGVSQETILAEWKGRMELGTKVHKHIEDTLNGVAPIDDPFVNLNEQPAECETFYRFWQNSLSKLARPYKTEWIVGDYELGLGGTIDSILYYPQSDSYHIFDWKTNSKFNTKSDFGERLYEPFSELDACELTKYSLQVSIYKLILKRNTDLNIGAGYIVHLSPEECTVHKAIDLTERIEAYILNG